jgi:lipopolysaccharide/colanic/teichoic acid biosynthesis glycosyltransferase
MNSRISSCILAVDVIWLVLASGLSYGLRFGEFELYPPPIYRVSVLAAAGVWVLLLKTLALDCFDGGWRFHVMLSRIVRATGLLMIFLIALPYLTKLYYSRLQLICFGLLLLVGFLLIRVGVYLFLRSWHRKGHTKKVVLVGNERLTRECAFKIGRHPELLYEVVGMLYPEGDAAASDSARTSNGELLSSFDVVGALAERKVDELIVLLDQSPGPEFPNFVARCRAENIRVKVLPRAYELYTSRPRLVEIDGLPLISLEDPATLPGAATVKRAMDLTVGTLLLPPAVCIFMLAALVLLCHRRQVLRRELRIGKGGRAFWMYRLDIDRDGENGPRYERLMRDLSISEIPQIWNVLLGEMSLVGPRPESPERVKHYSEWQKGRLRAKPGLTGLAQVNGLREEHASEDKSRFDLQYMLEWSPLNDLLLVLQTIGTLVKRCLPPRFSAREQALPTQRNPLREAAHAHRA